MALVSKINFLIDHYNIWFFGSGNINGVEGSYTALLSNRNRFVTMDHTSAGLQIWNGRSGSNVQSAVNMYGQKITFNISAQPGLKEVSIDTNTHTLAGVDELLFKVSDYHIS